FQLLDFTYRNGQADFRAAIRAAVNTARSANSFKPPPQIRQAVTRRKALVRNTIGISGGETHAVVLDDERERIRFEPHLQRNLSGARMLGDVVQRFLDCQENVMPRLG